MWSIAGLTFASHSVLAPLAGYSDLPFRILCKRYGAAFCVSEMISCHGLCFGQKKTISMLESTEEEQPVSFQIFGAEAETMGRAAELVTEKMHAAMIDINMGCPVKKVTKRGAGAALMKDRKNAEAILTEVLKRTSLPVTVKIRTGPDADHINCVEFATMLEGCGAAAVTVHGRTWAQGFSGRADRAAIARVKEAVTIPVIGNGDVGSPEEAYAMMAETGCDAVMVGRGALGNPWVFSTAGKPGDAAALMAGALEHAELMERHLPVDRMLGCLKNQLGRYFRGLPGSSAMRKAVYASPDFASLKTLFQTKAQTN